MEAATDVAAHPPDKVRSGAGMRPHFLGAAHWRPREYRYRRNQLASASLPQRWVSEALASLIPAEPGNARLSASDFIASRERLRAFSRSASMRSIRFPSKTGAHTGRIAPRGCLSSVKLSRKQCRRGTLFSAWRGSREPPTPGYRRRQETLFISII